MGQPAYIDEDEEVLSPEEQAEVLKLFRPVHLSGPRATELRRAHLARVAHFRSEEEPTRNERPTPSSPGLTRSQTLFGAAIAVSAGLLVGWFWRKHREKAAREKSGVIKITKPRDLVGLDVVISGL